MVNKERSAANLELIGGAPCLDFANTVSTRIEAQRREYLTNYRELVAWSQHAQLLSMEDAQSLLHTACHHPDRAAAVLERAIALRETLYRVFAALAHDREPQDGDLMALNTALQQALSRSKIQLSAAGFEWSWAVARSDLDRMLWPIVRSAAELLTSEDLGRVSQCARDGCDWLFVDASKNHSRRWCSMDVCGSRVKARRYYRRKKHAALKN
jgi:predicted RNA-binding Zn ribbon-like protein